MVDGKPESNGDHDPQNDATAQPLADPSAEEIIAVKCASLALSPSILDEVSEVVEGLGVAGETKIARILYLVMTSRLLDRPVSMIIKGPSSGGKSFVLKTVLKLFPPESYWLRASISPMLLARTSESFVHRVLIFEEAAGLNDKTEYFLRVLLSEGEIVHSSLSKGADGNWKEEIFRKEGPTGLVLTTTEVGLHPENETRMLSVSISDTREQTRLALLAVTETRHSHSNSDVHQRFQEWLASQDNRVRIPFERELAVKTSTAALRIRRDFNLVLSLIKTHTLLHQLKRTRDAEGYLLATLADYEAVYDLIADIISHGVEASVPDSVRQTVEAVRAASTSSQFPDGVPLSAVATALGIDKSGASRRVKVAISLGYLTNFEDAKGKVLRLVVADPMPDGEDVLPHPDSITHRCTVAPNTVDGRPHGEKQ